MFSRIRSQRIWNQNVNLTHLSTLSAFWSHFAGCPLQFWCKNKKKNNLKKTQIHPRQHWIVAAVQSHVRMIFGLKTNAAITAVRASLPKKKSACLHTALRPFCWFAYLSTPKDPDTTEGSNLDSRSHLYTAALKKKSTLKIHVPSTVFFLHLRKAQSEWVYPRARDEHRTNRHS